MAYRKSKRFTEEREESESKMDVKAKGVKQTTTNGRRGRKGNKNAKRASNPVDSGAQPHIRGTNDYRWYAYNDQLLRDTCSVGFNYPTGYNLPDALARSNANWAQVAGALRIPGIISINLVPTYGISNDQNSPINVAARQVYNFIRAENSGHANYDAVDYMMYLLAVDSVFSFYAFLMRIYGIVTHYTFFDAYSPDAIIMSMGVNPNDIRENFAQFRAFINLYAAKMGTLLVPKSFNIFLRHAQMYGNVYKDSDSSRAQLYLYNPECFYEYNPTGSGTGATLDTVVMRDTIFPNVQPAAQHSFNDLQNIGNVLLSAATDEDFIIMAGDTLKAFGSENLWKQEDIDEQFKLEPIFDFTWLTQIQNAMSLDRVGGFQTAADNKYKLEQVIPGGNLSPWIKTTFELSSADNLYQPWWDHEALMVSPFEVPTQGDIIESSRLLFTADYGTDSGGNHICTITSCGSEIASNFQLFTQVGTGGARHLHCYNLSSHSVVPTSSNLSTALDGLVRTRILLDCFNMHPTIFVIRDNENVTDPNDLSRYTLLGVATDLDNYAVVSKETISRMHELALLSMLYVRGSGVVDPLVK